MMFQRHGLAAFAMLATVAAAAAQNPGVIIRNSPEELKSAVKPNKDANLTVRPNNQETYFVFVSNDRDQPLSNISVRMTRDTAGKDVIAQGKVEGEIEKNSAVRVKLVSAAPPAPVDPKADPKAAPPPAGTKLPPFVHLHLWDDKTGKKYEGSISTEVRIRLMVPKEYITASAQADDAKDKGFTLTVKLAATPTFSGPPAKARLEIRPELMPGLDKDSLKNGTYETVVSSGAKNVELIARNLRFNPKPKEGRFSVSVDGYTQSFAFTTDFSGNNPTAFTEPATRIDVPEYAITGKPLSARLEVYNDPEPDQFPKPDFKFHRTENGDPEPVTAKFDTPRDQNVRGVFGAEGEWTIATEVKDWLVPLDTAGMYRQRKLSFTLATKSNLKVIGSDAFVTFDDTPPENVRFTTFAPLITKKKMTGTIALVDSILDVAATADEPESKVSKVLFWIGDTPPGPDGKAPPAVRVVEGSLFAPPPPKGDAKTSVPPLARVWTAKLQLPENKGRVKVWVRFINAAGLAAEDKFHDVNVQELDPPEPKPTTGTIEGKVIRGSSPEIPQPELPVQLLDAGGKVVDATITGADGTFKFTEVKPGAYKLYTIKKSDFGAKGTKLVKVVAGETTKGEKTLLEILR